MYDSKRGTLSESSLLRSVTTSTDYLLMLSPVFWGAAFSLGVTKSCITPRADEPLNGPPHTSPAPKPIPPQITDQLLTTWPVLQALAFQICAFLSRSHSSHKL